MSSCQAGSHVKVGVVWAVMAGQRSPQDRRARGRGLGVLLGLAAGEDNGQRGYMLTFVIAYLRVGHSSGFSFCRR
ncbi:Alkyldihydroxyacetonephosphate synthase, peroxisomal [Liparis tanakae]|uniref:Alkyldihydroxyacetonephosphate synthase, peroxisomal n=1 Tax=Liparis tanakae TaxID=230148 RepID=A0A4Z2EDH8_9TELE|nr:Alkyldihydroxyacetonephosphate synthase, peroxisomal [Liparis tanakae]